MSKLILQQQITLDGFVCGPRGEVDWAFPGLDNDAAVWVVEHLWQAGFHLMGAVTYRDMAATWPHSAEPYAPPMNNIPKIVFSRNLKEAPWGETQIIAGDLTTEIARLKNEPGRDLLAHGGVRFVRALIRSGLVDEYRLITHPVVLGDGSSLFSECNGPLRFTLVESTIFKTGTIAKVFRPSAALDGSPSPELYRHHDA